MRELNIRWLGKLPYGEAYILQKGLHAATSQESSPFDYLLLLEHNNVVTIGRSGDINNLLVSKNILNENNIEYVINFAAQSHVQNSFDDSIQFTFDNILGTHTLLECCKKYNKIKKFIHVSTDEVYPYLHHY